MRRRDFLKMSAAGTAGLFVSRMPVMAGPFTRADFEHLVPADKKLSPDWVKSLYDRGEPQVFRDRDLDKIGMPVGGIGAGQLYLGGDGSLWRWDIFNCTDPTDDTHYATPPGAVSPVRQQFSIEIDGQIRPLNDAGFEDIAFRGEYPIGIVQYRDPELPLSIQMEAFSPFIPLNAEDSSLPATILQFTVRNTASIALTATLRGRLDNPVCLYHRGSDGVLRNEIVAEPGLTTLLYSAGPAPRTAGEHDDIVFEDWSGADYGKWQVEGTAFGSGPIKKSDMPAYQGDVGGDSDIVVNSHASAPGDTTVGRDSATGRLTSPDFIIQRNFILFWIGGGRKDELSPNLGLTLWLDDFAVMTAAGKNDNLMTLQSFDVREYQGRRARIEIVDDATGSWGNIGVGRIIFSDHQTIEAALQNQPDFGTMALALLGGRAQEDPGETTAPFSGTLPGKLSREFTLGPDEAVVVSFIIAWHFPNLDLGGYLGKPGRYYAAKFASARDVVQYISKDFDGLVGQTKLWRDTWYDSSLPYWFLDRTFLNASTLATSTCFRLRNGRFYAWEGVGCCPGTCTHVWHYAHALARLFPEIERDTRERVDLNMAMSAEGIIGFRAEYDHGLAVDGQAGTLLRCYREHQMCPDNSFLERVWPQIRLAFEPLLKLDGEGAGILTGPQMNTLDTPWYGKIAWTSSLYLAALSAGQQMALEMNDVAFADRCDRILRRGAKHVVDELFDGEYFYNRIDPAQKNTINSGSGCEIDQVFGQSWAFQVNLPRVLPPEETRSALRSLWRYNFSPNVGDYRRVYPVGRWFALAGEAGLIMCTFPRSGWNFRDASGAGNHVFAGYFDECMCGFEYQVAGHMLWEDMSLEGLAITRAIHDRYHPSKRNPWNEVECGDHYARSMASYGVYLAACGFKYHGPRGHIGFHPKVTPGNFKCAFTSATGWGTFAQQRISGTKQASIHLKWGALALNTISLGGQTSFSTVKITLNRKPLDAGITWVTDSNLITLPPATRLNAGDTLQILLS